LEFYDEKDKLIIDDDENSEVMILKAGNKRK
jgi:hypothetical protein